MTGQTQLDSSRNLTTDDFIKTSLKKASALGGCENDGADAKRLLRKKKRGKRRPLADIHTKPLEDQPDIQKEPKRARVDAVKLIDSVVCLKDGTRDLPNNVQRHHFNSTISWSTKREQDP